MTSNDKNLIEEFSNLHYTQWMDVDRYIDAADTQECKDRLRVISTMMFHKEEFHSNNI